MASSTPSLQQPTFPFARTIGSLQQDDTQTLPLPSNTIDLCLNKFGVIPKRQQLTALTEEQHQKLKDKGVSSITIHGDIRLPLDIGDRMAGEEFKAVFSTAEKAVVDGELFTNLYRRSSWRSRLLAVVIDEAHCVSTWGASFRMAYNSIGDLRVKVPPCLPFVAMSATFSLDIMRDVKEKLHFTDDAVVVKINTDRRNIKYVVQSFRSKADAFKSLEFLLDFEKAIVYFDNKFDLLAAKNHLRRMASGKRLLSVATTQILLSKAARLV
ncbi:hypothetical protein EC957_010925 [Mortierella hygrophila]|uniref:Helicase ATP-binding domain-containing protein n=1 Tax=Mortierella hygrophila TaxID=979708 RepID=A0A9P6K3R7_9FUNG|nr:hypothetical protein EC957_010925 [Mortierella hygrophila]